MAVRFQGGARRRQRSRPMLGGGVPRRAASGRGGKGGAVPAALPPAVSAAAPPALPRARRQRGRSAACRLRSARRRFADFYPPIHQHHGRGGVIRESDRRDAVPLILRAAALATVVVALNASRRGHFLLALAGRPAPVSLAVAPLSFAFSAFAARLVFTRRAFDRDLAVLIVPAGSEEPGR